MLSLLGLYLLFSLALLLLSTLLFSSTLFLSTRGQSNWYINHIYLSIKNNELLPKIGQHLLY